MDAELHRTVSPLEVQALYGEGCRVQGVGSFRSSSAPSDLHPAWNYVDVPHRRCLLYTSDAADE